ncbi:nucleoside triphosphate pyrophosphohydrolase [Motilimonas cestriensis]|uniref:Nucleoside triphosphate pyrophosphohydrolase n=1 Tax=Motilimonas cestriensis TaxID=2742685 RepID=A0ABS8WCD6_9GAMM|nr:nucleoside triphosphate pyrophosphohydrolase [Motilimonas cestriensis]MCE2596218.1 nucleoside triphosphate pyrophosphohydrolase [Motilimonas cestriensis]
MSSKLGDINGLLAIMEKLRDPESGCPWDQKQTFRSIVPHTIEEAYEVADAIEQQDYIELKGELGDLLFQVVFYAQLAKEQQLFDFNDVVEAVSEKLTRRHPHVFGGADFADELAVKANWEAEKAQERAAKVGEQVENVSVLDNIPTTMPALTRANKIQKRCATVGFDWKTLGPVVDKIKEEIDEVLDEVHQVNQDQDRIEDEVGDLLFATVNLVRHLKKDPEQALRRANDKFERRFRLLEKHFLSQNKALDQCSLDEMEQIWQKVKETYES